MNREMLQRRLERRGYTVETAEDGEWAIANTKLLKPDLVLMDIDLPNIDGLEATRRLKADATTTNIPIIALTAKAMAGDREQALDAGCDDYLTKPVDFKELLAMIERFLGAST